MPPLKILGVTPIYKFFVPGPVVDQIIERANVQALERYVLAEAAEVSLKIPRGNMAPVEASGKSVVASYHI
ncbi:MAG: hypothetical protein KQJ78_03170 [Deltaproteobacteria bacterium]|nr:hypothetical protein [Deltaproteobacteria bacterium]